MNEIFFLGKKVLIVCDILFFVVCFENENVLIEVKNGKYFVYCFCININDGLLKESYIGLFGIWYGINWCYDKFCLLEQRQFLGIMMVFFEGVVKLVMVVFEFFCFFINKDWEVYIEVFGKYERIEL